MMMEERRKQVREEFEHYYGVFEADTPRLLSLLEEQVWKEPCAYSYEKKALMHEILCRECKVHLFAESSFFFEIVPEGNGLPGGDCSLQWALICMKKQQIFG